MNSFYRKTFLAVLIFCNQFAKILHLVVSSTKLTLSVKQIRCRIISLRKVLNASRYLVERLAQKKQNYC